MASGAGQHSAVPAGGQDLQHRGRPGERQGWWLGRRWGGWQQEGSRKANGLGQSWPWCEVRPQEPSGEEGRGLSVSPSSPPPALQPPSQPGGRVAVPAAVARRSPPLPARPQGLPGPSLSRPHAAAPGVKRGRGAGSPRRGRSGQAPRWAVGAGRRAMPAPGPAVPPSPRLRGQLPPAPSSLRRARARVAAQPRLSGGCPGSKSEGVEGA